MAVAFVSATAHAGNPTTSATVTLPTTANGDILIAQANNAGANTALTLSGTYGGGAWTSIDSGGWTSGWGGVWWSRASGNHSGQTVIAGTATDSISLMVTRFSGALTSGSPLDSNIASGTVAAGANATLAAFTTTVANTLVVLCFSIDDNIAVSAPLKNAVAMGNLSQAASTGGNDSEVGNASLAQAAAATTGTFAITVAAGTNQGKRMTAFALKPAFTTTTPDRGRFLLKGRAGAGSGTVVGGNTMEIVTEDASGWTATADQAWCSVTASGSSGGLLTVTADPTSLSNSVNTATITISAAGATDITRTVVFIVSDATSAPSDAGGAALHALNPISHWRMDDASGGPVDRENVHALTANANTSGIVYSQPSLHSGGGTSVSLGGGSTVAGNFSRADANSLDLAGEYTLLIFCKADTIQTGSFQRLFAKGATYGLRWHSTTAAIEHYMFTGTVQKSQASSTGWAANTAYLIIATYDRTIGDASATGSMKLYRNGSQVDAVGTVITGDADNTASVLNIGANNAAGVEGFDGFLDEAALFNYALSAAEITALYAAYSQTAIVGSDTDTAVTETATTALTNSVTDADVAITEVARLYLTATDANTVGSDASTVTFGAVNNTGSDAGTATETATLTRVSSRTDANTVGSNTAATTAAHSRTDSGTDTETTVSSRNRVDSGTGTQAATLTYAASRTDANSTAVQTATRTAAHARTDSGTGTETATRSVTRTVTDANSTAVQTATLTYTTTRTDTNSVGSNTATLARSSTRTDSGAGANVATLAITNAVSGFDSATSTQTASLAVAHTVTQTASGSENKALTFARTRTDSSSSVVENSDVAIGLTTVSASDSGSGTNVIKTLTVVSATAHQTGTGTEQAISARTRSVSDTGSGAQTAASARANTVSQLGSGTEIVAARASYARQTASGFEAKTLVVLVTALDADVSVLEVAVTEEIIPLLGFRDVVYPLQLMLDPVATAMIFTTVDTEMTIVDNPTAMAIEAAAETVMQVSAATSIMVINVNDFGMAIESADKDLVIDRVDTQFSIIEYVAPEDD